MRHRGAASRQANSSPPSRPNRSPGRIDAGDQIAEDLSTRSPAWWPAVSLTSLKRSRSNSSSAAGRRSAIAASSSWLAAVEESAAIGDAGQRIGQRRLSLLQLAAFLRHGDPQERQAEGDEQRSKGHDGDDRALRLTASDRSCQHLGEGNARQQKASMRHDQHQCRPARDQLAVARVPKLARSQQRIAREHNGNEINAGRASTARSVRTERRQSRSPAPVASKAMWMRRPSNCGRRPTSSHRRRRSAALALQTDQVFGMTTVPARAAPPPWRTTR